MGFFSFENDFEVTSNHPKAEVFEKFSALIKKKRWTITSIEQAESISFRTKTTLLSWPIDFDVKFISNDENSTALSVHICSMHLDMGRSKGIINDLIKEMKFD